MSELDNLDEHSPVSVIDPVSSTVRPPHRSDRVSVYKGGKCHSIQNHNDQYSSSLMNQSGAPPVVFEPSQSECSRVGCQDCPQIHSVIYDLDIATYKQDPIGTGVSGLVHQVEVPTIIYNERGPTKMLTKMALKTFVPSLTNMKSYQRESRALQILHDIPGVIGIYGSLEVRESDIVHRLIMLELAARGDLMDLMLKFKGGLPEALAHAFSTQLWETVAQCHDLGVAHRDIKPENILITKDYELRLADFGTAYISRQEDQEHQDDQELIQSANSSPCGHTSTSEYCGTQMYLSPEVALDTPYEPKGVDVWSAGVVTFMLLMGVPPFFKDRRNCWFYLCVKKGRWDKFWEQHEKLQPDRLPISAEAKDFLQQALNLDPRVRPAAREMKQHQWLASFPEGAPVAGSAARPEAHPFDVGVFMRRHSNAP